MKAAVLFNCGEPLRVLEGLEAPALSRGQVLVRVAYSGVCHSQLMEVRGARGPDRWLPHLLGHEGSGTVLAVGEGVTKVVPSDRVVLSWIKGEGMDAPGPQYRWCDRIINAGGVTTFNSRAVVAENRLVKLPEGLPLDVAVLFGCAVPTGAGMALNEITASPASRVAVFGIGGIGIIALMALRAVGCRQVIAVDVSPFKLAVARRYGATEAINADAQDPVAAIRALTGGAGVDYAIDAAGLTGTIEQAFASVRRGGGQCVFASHPENGAKICLDPHELISGKRIFGSWGGATHPDADLPRYAAMFRRGQLPLSGLIERRYSLEQVNEALEDLAAGRVMRPLLEIDP